MTKLQLLPQSFEVLFFSLTQSEAPTIFLVGTVEEGLVPDKIFGGLRDEFWSAFLVTTLFNKQNSLSV